MVSLRTHALSATADSFAPPNSVSVIQGTSSGPPLITSGYEHLVLPQIPAPNVQLSTTTTVILNDNDATSSESQIKEGKTPNVYINGLPPHFPDESLFDISLSR